eukprot:GHVS01027679.1.p1 GENE.GHVS01027679.1~~GHVS01027679.1.p1  ORF type:complete len:203 (+),score=20.03 GHVS01027679.1:111-719(+)
MGRIRIYVKVNCPKCGHFLADYTAEHEDSNKIYVGAIVTISYPTRCINKGGVTGAGFDWKGTVTSGAIYKLKSYDLESLSNRGRMTNNSGEAMLVYGKKGHLSRWDNELQCLKNGMSTPDEEDWDCDGFYVPVDRTVSQAVLGDVRGPAAIKFSGLQTWTVHNGGPGIYALHQPNVGVYRHNDVNWEIPTTYTASDVERMCP